MSRKPTLTAERLRQLVEYRDGELFWRDPTGNMKLGPLGALAGHGRRLQAQIDGRAHYVHRLVWLYHYGVWPAKQVDHINGDKLDNRIENLREVTNAENTQNVDRAGVSHDKRNNKWRARIMVDGRSISLGYHATRAEARCAYLRAKEIYHPAWVTGVGRAA